MITVTVGSGSGWVDIFLLRREIRGWCREHIGMNPRQGSRLWRTGSDVEFPGNPTRFRLQVSFLREEDAAMFMMRWS